MGEELQKAKFDKPLEVKGVDLYSLNKEMMAKEKPLSTPKYKEKLLEIKRFFNDAILNKNKKYYMLLCHEKRHYTVFNFVNKNIEEGIKQLDNVLQFQGKILAIDFIPNNQAFEIWILRDDEPCMYALFNYDPAVIEC